MADIQLGTTLGATSGTGALMTPYKLSGDTALYKESSPASYASELLFKRTDPKPTSTYVGASKGEVKLTRYYTDTAGRKWPAVVTISSSIPDFRTNAEKLAFVTEALVAMVTTQGKENLAYRTVPQS